MLSCPAEEHGTSSISQVSCYVLLKKFYDSFRIGPILKISFRVFHVLSYFKWKFSIIAYRRSLAVWKKAIDFCIFQLILNKT